MKEKLWQLFYSRWPRRHKTPAPGYSLLLLIPGDLPVFLKIALEVCKRQNFSNCLEAIVIPDQRSEGFRKRFDAYQEQWQGPPLRLAELNPLESFLTKRFNNPHMNCWLQITRGVSATQSTHALWHDADLFINEPDFLKRHYQLCAERDLACLGVSPAWDGWYAQKGFGHLTATWELMINADWMRQWAPWEHRGQWRSLEGENHEFDILFWAQCHTAPEKIARHKSGHISGEHDFVHFNYVIATYRWFQRANGPFEDNRFLLLLVRMLINAFDERKGDESDWHYEVPDVQELALGIHDGTQRVTYVSDKARENYPEFRDKLRTLLNGPLLDARQKSRMLSDLAIFDDHLFACTPLISTNSPEQEENLGNRVLEVAN